jgi:adenine deaminase
MSRREGSTGDPKSGVDLLLRDARILDVFSGKFWRGDVAVAAGRIVGFGAAAAREIRDLNGAWLVPGLIDAHVHIESSQLTPGQFARAVVPHGTTCVIADPHEIANVLGPDGVRYMLDATDDVPLHAYFMAPSCVPSSPFETSGATLGENEIAEILSWERVLGLGEVMNYPGVVRGDSEIAAKLAVARGRPIDGHAPGLSGRRLWAYVGAGPRTDHECTTLEEAREKLRAGLRILIREGTTARNLDALLPLLDERTAPFVHFCTDDRDSQSLLAEGHIDDLVRRAIAAGVRPEVAIASATIHPARTYGLFDHGAIGPGYRADLIVLSDLRSFEVREVYVDGIRAAGDGRSLFEAPPDRDRHVLDTVRVDLARLSFRLDCDARTERRVRALAVGGDRVITDAVEVTLPCVGGEVVTDPEQDIAKLAVVERHKASGAVGVGFVRGLGLASGALASTVAHDAHNAIVAGTRDEDMCVAIRELARIGGGQVVVEAGNVVARLSLPIAGLMSDRPLAEVAAEARGLTDAARRLGCSLPAPFATLSFLALPVIPHLKLTDRGLVDVDEFRLISCFLDDPAS